MTFNLQIVTRYNLQKKKKCPMGLLVKYINVL